MIITLNEQIAVMQAFKRGANIEFRAYGTSGPWIYTAAPRWNWDEYAYRVQEARFECYCVLYRNGRVGATQPTYEAAQATETGDEIIKIMHLREVDE